MSNANANERYLASLVNQARRAEGLAPLKLEKRLNDSAEAHSSWMLAADKFSHTGQGGSSARQRIDAAGFDLAGDWMTAENIAYVGIQGAGDLRDEVRSLHQNLMNSPSHYANIMSDAAFIGIGLEIGELRVGGRDYQVLMATQNFADTDGQLRLDNGGFVRVAEPQPNESMQSRAAWLQGFDGQSFVGPAAGTARNDDYRLTPQDDRVSAGRGHDWVVGGDGNDLLDGGGGHDRLIGSAGADTLLGGGGHDTLQGGIGFDHMTGGVGDDMMRGDGGNDKIWGEAGNDRMFGGTGHDAMNGGTGNDWLMGEGGNDTLVGGEGNDMLIGGAGNDLLNGGPGADTFVFEIGGGVDTVHAYQHGVDRLIIDADRLDANPAVFMRDHMTKTASGVLIDLGDGDRIHVNGPRLTVEGVADDIFGY